MNYKSSFRVQWSRRLPEETMLELSLERWVASPVCKLERMEYRNFTSHYLSTLILVAHSLMQIDSWWSALRSQNPEISMQIRSLPS